MLQQLDFEKKKGGFAWIRVDKRAYRAQLGLRRGGVLTVSGSGD